MRSRFDAAGTALHAPMHPHMPHIASAARHQWQQLPRSTITQGHRQVAAPNMVPSDVVQQHTQWSQHLMRLISRIPPPCLELPSTSPLALPGAGQRPQVAPVVRPLRLRHARGDADRHADSQRGSALRRAAAPTQLYELQRKGTAMTPHAMGVGGVGM